MKYTSRELTEAIKDGKRTLQEDMQLFSYYPDDIGYDCDYAVDSNGKRWVRIEDIWYNNYDSQKVILDDPDPIVLPISVLIPHPLPDRPTLLKVDDNFFLSGVPTIYTRYRADWHDAKVCQICHKSLVHRPAWFDKIYECLPTFCDECVEIIPFKKAVAQYVASLCE